MFSCENKHARRWKNADVEDRLISDAVLLALAPAERESWFVAAEGADGVLGAGRLGFEDMVSAAAVGAVGVDSGNF